MQFDFVVRNILIAKICSKSIFNILDLFFFQMTYLFQRDVMAKRGSMFMEKAFKPKRLLEKLNLGDNSEYFHANILCEIRYRNKLIYTKTPRLLEGFLWGDQRELNPR